MTGLNIINSFHEAVVFSKWIVAAALFFVAATVQAAEYRLPPTQATCTVDQHSFPVHIAATIAERAKGFASAPPALIRHSAILFIYPPKHASVSGPDFYFGAGTDRPPSATVHGYYNMRHMLALLDIAFMDRDGRVLAVLRMIPGSRLYRPKKPYAAALEIAAGRAALLGLQRGAMLECHG